MSAGQRRGRRTGEAEQKREGEDQQKEPWQKILWKKQDYPDNFVPRSFLGQLKRNANYRPYAYTPLVLSSLAITQHFSSILIFVSLFVRLYHGSLEARTLVSWGSFATAAGLYAWETVFGKAEDGKRRSGTNVGWARRGRVLSALRSSLVLAVTLLSVSPVLRTLTEATTSDSIWAMSAALFCMNAVLAEYGRGEVKGGGRSLSSTLSLNAGISASVVLASRLSSDHDVFALILFAVQWFALFPLGRRYMRSLPPPASHLFDIILSIVLLAFTLYLLVPLSATAAFAYIVSVVLVSFACPAWLVGAQKWKNEITGPWDPAVPKLRVRSDSLVVPKTKTD